MAEETSDHDLLRAHVEGDPEAFGLLFARHRDRLWAVALRTSGDREEAADALQDALVAAFSRAGSYRGDAAVTTWLHRIVVNACLDRFRRERVRHALPLPDDARETVGRLAADASPPEDPADHAEREEQRRTVLAALATLPAEQRAALVLVDMQGCSVAEAAAVLEVPAGTVKSRCSRGRARLARLLSDPSDGHESAEGSQTGTSRVPPSTGPSSPPSGGEHR